MWSLDLEARFKSNIYGMGLSFVIADLLRGHKRNEAFIIDIFRAKFEVIIYGVFNRHGVLLVFFETCGLAKSCGGHGPSA